VEIGGDTTELSKALKGVDGNAKKTTDELKSVNAALKVDPTNIVALTQKQELLAQSINNTKKKIDILKQAERDAQKQLEKGEIGQEQYRALQREVVFAEAKLKKLEKQLDDTKKAAQGEGEAVEKSGKDAMTAAKDHDKLGKSLDDLKEDYDKAKTAAKDAAKEFGATLAAGAAAVGATAAVAMNYEDALSSIQIQTGANAQAMQSYELAMKAVFDSGLGEDLNDVANTMAVIAQQTHETDPEKLQQMAENALILKENFGFETAEQMRAVNMLTSQFGISADQAYSLIVQGAQKGLNKNGDLLDVINEYSVHYKSLGYDADGFFNSLANGVATGVFSVDKLGDATKEFGIKTKDEAASTTEAYEILGLNADEMRKKFAAGGEEAKQAAKTVNDALFSMSDEVKQNTAGVALYGTMWEDMGKDAIAAIGDVNGEISATVDAMEQVRAVKMESTSTKWAALGRTVQTELLIPMGEKLLPAAMEFFDFCIENSEDLIPIAKALGVTIASIFVTNKVSKFTSSISTLTKTFSKLKNATGGLSGAFGTTTAAGIAFAATLGPLIAKTEAASEAYRESVAALKTVAEEYHGAAEAAEDSARRQQDAYNNVSFDYKKYDDLVDEFYTLIDVNGKVKAGYEDRANYISGTLSEATGVEIEIIDGVVQKYDELSNAINDALTKRKTYDLLGNMESDYLASKETLAGDKSVLGSQMAYENARTIYNELTRIANDSSMNYDEKNEAMKQYDMDYVKWIEGGGKQSILFGMQEAQRAYEYNLAVVDRYDDLYAAYLSQDAAKMRTASEKIANPQYSADDFSYATLREIQITAAETYENLLEYSKQEGTSVTQTQLDEAAEALEYATKQALIAYEAENKPDYTELEYISPKNPAPRHIRDMEFAAQEAEALLQKNKSYSSESPENPHLSGLALNKPSSIWQRFSEVTADAPLPADLGIANDETVKQSNSILGQILKRVEELDLKIVLDDGTIISRADHTIGTRANDEKRGSLK